MANDLEALKVMLIKIEPVGQFLPKNVPITAPKLLSEAYVVHGERALVQGLIRAQNRVWLYHALVNVSEFSPEARRALAKALMTRHVTGPSQFLMALLVLAITGLFAVALNLQFFHVEKLWIFKDNVSIISGLIDLWKGSEMFLFFVIFIFTIVFPVTKLIVLLYAALSYETAGNRTRRVVEWIAELGRFSMLDVFVVTILVVLVKASTIVNMKIGLGIYVFTAVVVLAQLMSWWLQHTLDRGAEDIDNRALWADRVLSDTSRLSEEEQSILTA